MFGNYRRPHPAVAAYAPLPLRPRPTVTLRTPPPDGDTVHLTGQCTLPLVGGGQGKPDYTPALPPLSRDEDPAAPAPPPPTRGDKIANAVIALIIVGVCTGAALWLVCR